MHLPTKLASFFDDKAVEILSRAQVTSCVDICRDVRVASVITLLTILYTKVAILSVQKVCVPVFVKLTCTIWQPINDTLVSTSKKTL